MVLTELRKIYKISMKDLADAISVSKQLIGQIEKGNRVITDEVLNKLVEYFGLNQMKITNDYRSFFTKDTMDQIEVQKIKIVKLDKESEELEFVGKDIITGETIISHHNTIDLSALATEMNKLRNAELIKIIEDRLCISNSISNNGLKEQATNNKWIVYGDGVIFYEKIVDLDSKADQYVFDKIIKALSIITSGGFDLDVFTNKLVKIIKDELENERKAREET